MADLYYVQGRFAQDTKRKADKYKELGRPNNVKLSQLFYIILFLLLLAD